MAKLSRFYRRNVSNEKPLELLTLRTAMPYLALQERIEEDGYGNLEPDEVYELCLTAYGDPDRAEEARCQRMKQIMDAKESRS